MAHLSVIEGDDRGTVFPLTGAVTTIGRHPDNQAALNDGAASRFHAKIERRGGQHYVVDLGSTHGTFVNEVRTNVDLLLAPGDRIRIGSTTLVFETETPDESKTAKTAPPGATPQAVDLPGETIAFSLPAGGGPAPEGLSDQYTERIQRVARAIQSLFDLDQLLTTLMDTIFEVFRPEHGVLLMHDKEGQLVPHIRRPDTGDWKVSTTVLDHAIEHRSSLLVSDMTVDDRFSGAESIMAQSILSAICSPLVSKDKVLGALYIDTSSHRLTYKREDLALLNIIAANAAIAIENAILVQEKVEAERLAAIGVAVAGISHYAKNILAGIMGASGLIEMGLQTDNLAMVRETWPILQRSNKKITGLVQDMLSYSKRREPNWESGNLNTLLEEIAEQQGARAAELGVELRLDLRPGLPDSQFDHQSIHDTLLNIAGNAIEACEGIADARVILQSERAGDNELRVSIIDNGPGIPDDIAKKIFEPFFSTKGSKGTGLGLAVARKAVQEHGGKLLLESRVGEGTTFHCHLPIEPPPSSVTQA